MRPFWLRFFNGIISSNHRMICQEMKQKKSSAQNWDTWSRSRHVIGY